MMPLQVGNSLQVLCIGAHPDDIEIGCGGSLLDWGAARRPMAVTWFVGSGEGERIGEQQASASRYFAHLGCGELVHERFPDNRFPSCYSEIKQALVSLSKRIKPDIVFTHRLEDRHQDHRLLAELTWNIWRDSLVLEYEIPKWEGDLGQPAMFSEVSAWAMKTKLDWLEQCHQSQATKDWFDRELFAGLMRLRGSECRSASRFAEAFHCRKAKLALSVVS